MATFIGAAALHERAQNAVRRVDAGNGVGERRTQESGPARIDHHAEEAAERLGNRVITRSFRIRPLDPKPLMEA